MRRAKISALIIALAAMLMFTMPALAITPTIKLMRITNNGDTPLDFGSYLTNFPTQTLVDEGKLGADGLDARLTSVGGGDPLPMMLTNTKVLTVASLTSHGTASLYFTTNHDAAASMPIIVGNLGYFTTADSPAIELRNNFTLTITGLFDTSFQTSIHDYIMDKDKAFRIYVYDDQTIRAAILDSSGAEVCTATISGVDTNEHTLVVSGDGDKLSISVDGGEAVVSDEPIGEGVPDNSSPITWDTHNVMPYILNVSLTRTTGSGAGFTSGTQALVSYQEMGVNDYHIYGSDTKFSQSFFTDNAPMSYSSADVYLQWYVDSGTIHAQADLYLADENYLPIGSSLASGSIAITGSQAFTPVIKTIPFSSSVVLAPWTWYTLVLSAPDGLQDTKFIQWKVGSTGSFPGSPGYWNDPDWLNLIHSPDYNFLFRLNGSFTQIDNCDSLGDYNWTGINFVDVAADTSEKHEGTASIRMSIPDSLIAGGLVASDYWNNTLNVAANALKLWVRSSVSLDAGDMTFEMYEGIGWSIVQTINVPAIAANTWTEVSLPLIGDYSNFEEIDTKMLVDKGAFDFWVDDIRGDGYASDVTAEEGSSLNSWGGHRNIAVDSAGKIWVAAEGPTSRNVTVRYSTNGGTTWTTSTTFDVNGDMTPNPALAVDSTNNVHLIYGAKISGSDYELEYAKWNGSNWSSPSRIDYSGAPNFYRSEADIAVDSNNKIHIVWREYHDLSDQIHYANNISGSWAYTAMPGAGATCQNPVIAIGPDNIPVVLYTRGGLYYTKATSNAGATWGTPLLVSNQAGGSYFGGQIYNSIAIDSTGKAHIAWTDLDDSNTYFQAVYNTVSSSGVVGTASALYLTTNGSYVYPSISIDRTGQLWVMMQYPTNSYGTIGRNAFVTYINGAWTTPADIGGDQSGYYEGDLASAWSYYPIIGGVHTNIAAHGFVGVTEDGVIDGTEFISRGVTETPAARTTEVLKYNPNTIIQGNVLPDLQGNQDAVIHWGVNDPNTNFSEFVTPTAPAVATPGSPGAGPGIGGGTQPITKVQTGTWTLPSLNPPLIGDLINNLLDSTVFGRAFFWYPVALLILLLAKFWAYRLTFSLFMKMLSGLVAVIALCAMSLLPWLSLPLFFIWDFTIMTHSQRGAL